MCTKKDEIKKILSDNEWHCVVCDLSFSSQPAAIIRDLAEEGYEFDNASDSATRTYKYGVKMWCEKCQRETTHRRRLKPERRQ